MKRFVESGMLMANFVRSIVLRVLEIAGAILTIAGLYSFLQQMDWSALGRFIHFL